jgi:hypothetical protein
MDTVGGEKSLCVLLEMKGPGKLELPRPDLDFLLGKA